MFIDVSTMLEHQHCLMNCDTMFYIHGFFMANIGSKKTLPTICMPLIQLQIRNSKSIFSFLGLGKILLQKKNTVIRIRKIVKQKMNAETGTQQWWIQDFPEKRASTLKVGVRIYYLELCLKSCIAMKRI